MEGLLLRECTINETLETERASLIEENIALVETRITRLYAQWRNESRGFYELQSILEELSEQICLLRRLRHEREKL